MSDKATLVQLPRTITIPIAVIAVIMVGASMHQLQSALLPFVVALFLSNIFRPLVSYLSRKRIPMVISILLVLLLVGGILFGVAMVGVSSVNSLVAALPRYEAKWEHVFLPNILDLLEHGPAELSDQVKNLKISSMIDGPTILGILSAGAGSIVSILSGLILILLFMLFILAGNGMVARKIKSAYPPDSASQLGSMLEKVDHKVQKYLMTVVAVNAVSSVITTIILSAFGVDLALLWGLLGFLVNFVPTIGSIIALVLPLSVAFLQFDSISTPIIVSIVLIITQFVLGSVITPRIMGSSLNLSPLLILISLIFWGWVWGPWGMILSVPITSTIKIIFENIEAMQPIAILMSAAPDPERKKLGLKPGGKPASKSATKQAEVPK